MATLYSGKTVHVHIRKTGKKFDRRWPRPSSVPPSQEQKKCQKVFGNKSYCLSLWFAENRPSGERPDGTEEYQRLMRAYRRQDRIHRFPNFVMSRMERNGMVR